VTTRMAVVANLDGEAVPDERDPDHGLSGV
jgi:hypothetical protein